MGYTLDQLLDETGANDLSGRRHTKTAAPEKPNFSKLAERCRQAVAATPEERAESDDHQLAEKTAAVEVIRRTMAEIAEIDGEAKIASALSEREAIFVKQALAAGHSEEAIAEFLEKLGAGRIGRFFGEAAAGLRSGRAARLGRKADDTAAHAVRSWQSSARKYESLSDAEKGKFLDRLRTKFGDSAAHEVLKSNKSFHHLPEWKKIQQAMPKPAGAGGGGGGPAKAVGVNVGGSQFGLTSEQLAKAKKPAMYLGAGMLAHRAIAKPDEPEKKKSGVVVVNS